MKYRIEEFAARCGVTVDTVRFYQTKKLLPPPERSGRVGLYSEEHAERLRQIHEWKARGLTLAAIRRLVSGDLDAADEALVRAVAEPAADSGATGETESFLTLDDLARAVGVSPALLDAVVREGLLVPRHVGGESRFTRGDVEAVSAGLALLEAGLPLSEFLALAREHDAAVRRVAEHAVEAFLSFVRDPIRASARDEAEAAERVVAAFRGMLPALGKLVEHHFRRVLLAAALERIEREGAPNEIDAVREEPDTDLETSWPA